jgi:glycosyltransferase involved in cell wall biosynthesis
LLSLGGRGTRDDIGDFDEVRSWRLWDFFALSGILHTHCLRADLIGGLLAFFGRRHVITTLHNYFMIDLSFDHKRWKVALAWCVWSRLVSCMDGVFCISHAMERYYKEKLPNARLKVAYNFRSPSMPAGQAQIDDLALRFLPWLSSQRLVGRRVMAFVGGIHRRKNILKFVEATSSHENIAIVVCGAGPAEDELRRLIVERGASDRVLMLGSVPRPDLVLEQCDALVLPSLAEGLPLVVLEAASLGKPSLLSNIAVHRELAHFGLGVIFDHRSFSDLDEALVKLEARLRNEHIVKNAFLQNFSSEIGFARYERNISPGK